MLLRLEFDEEGELGDVVEDDHGCEEQDADEGEDVYKRQVPAFLCWFGGTGYLLHQYSSLVAPAVLVLATMAGMLGASVLYVVLFKLLLPRERVMEPEETRMDGVVARVSDEIRAGGTGEILFSQADARRSAAARSESGDPIARGTEVVVLRYARGIAYVSPLEELMRRPSV